MNKIDTSFKNKKITVMGLGLHGGGVAVTKWLIQKGAKVLVTDLRDRKTLKLSLDKLKKFNIKYVLGKHRNEDFQSVDMIIKNPGVSRESKYLELARKNNIPIETDISLFFRMCKAPIIGITGTKGKSTATVLTYNIFKAAGKKPIMAGNIRISPLEILTKIQNNTPVILELSSWQLEDMAFLGKSPRVAVITNILPDHLNRYKSMDDYIKSKKVIFQYQRSSDFVILNYHNLLTKKLGKEVISHRYWFSINEFKQENGCFVRRGWIFFRNKGLVRIVCHIKDLEIPGQHNLENVLAAITVAKIYGIGNLVIKRVVRQFKGIPDRLEFIRRYKGKEFFNDTTATAPEATIASLSCFSDKVILIAGGEDKGLAYDKLARVIKKQVNYLVLLPGSATKKLIKNLKTINYSAWKLVKDMPAAVALAVKVTKQEKVIILSPGAASFGLFLNEFDRGEQFKKAVKSF